MNQRNQIPRPSLTALVLSLLVWSSAPNAQTDLDEFMRRVVTRRDENWKKLQQYVLDEHERIDIRAPGGASVWGERREYTWFIRDGYFVRSPLKVNGVTIGEVDRRTYEDDYVRREQRREKREKEGRETANPDAPADIQGLLRQPGFVSSAYFLRFKFDEGRYALVGRETLEGRDVLRIEYYPTRLFTDDDRDRERRRERSKQSEQYDRELQRLMNKTSLVTLWIDPATDQILKYVFDNVALDFLPGQWLLRVTDLKASMTMGEAFPDVWLPRGLELTMALSLASGRLDGRYAIEYHDYRQADVSSKVGFPEVR
jgi:hypothetical protein